MSLREKKTQRKKQKIIQSAVSIIAEKGFHATTMEEIAGNLLMTKGSIYYYFNDKQDLLYQSQVMILEQSIENVVGIMNQDLPIKDRLKSAIILHIEYLISERLAFGMGASPEQFFQGDQLDMILYLRDRYSNYFDQLIADGISENVFDVVDVKIVRNIILGAMNWVINWYSPQGTKDKTELATSISNYLLKILI